MSYELPQMVLFLFVPKSTSLQNTLESVIIDHVIGRSALTREVGLTHEGTGFP